MSELANELSDLEDAIRQGNEEQAGSLASKALAADIEPLEILQGTIVPTLKDIGDKFGRLEIFLPEMMMAAEAAKAVIAILDPALKARNEAGTSVGRVVIGTVAGDVHDIGKNMVATMLEPSRREGRDLFHT